MYTLVTKVCTCVEPDPMTHDNFNLDHYCTYYMLQKLQNGHVFYMYGVVFEHDKDEVLKGPPNERCQLKNIQSKGVCLAKFQYIFCMLKVRYVIVHMVP